MTIQELKQQAELVKNETQIGENTAERVGGVMVETIEHIKTAENNIESLKSRNLAEIPAFNGVVNSATVQNNGVMSYTGVYYIASAKMFAAKSGTMYYNVWAESANFPSNEAYNQEGKAVANRLYNSRSFGGGLMFFDGTTFQMVNDNGEVEELIQELENKSVKYITWDSSSNLGGLNATGLYYISGTRTSLEDGLPILNLGEFVAWLRVANVGGNRFISQTLELGNKAGKDTKVYTRSYDGSNWSEWLTSQGIHEKGAIHNVEGINKYTDNGIYSGLVTNGGNVAGLQINQGSTILVVTINGYAVGNYAQCTQMLYLLPTGYDFINGVSQLMGAKMYARTGLWGETQVNWGDWDKLATEAELEALDSKFENIPLATTENDGLMSAEDKKVAVESKVKLTQAIFTDKEYAGIFCSNVNTGKVGTADSTSNGIIIPVKGGEVYEIVGENLKYGLYSVQFYSGYPSLDTNVTKVDISDNKVTVPQGATYMLVSVNPSLGVETTIKQLNWASVEDLPKSYKEALDNIGSEYKTQVINVTQGTAAGNNTIFPISLLGEGDIIQIYVNSDIDTKMSLVTRNGYVIQTITTNQVIVKEITADDITGDAFGFYINSTQATQSGILNCSLRIAKKDTSSITLSKSLINLVNIPKDVSAINKNLGSNYHGLMVNVEAGKLLDARKFISTDVASGYNIEFIAECDEDITYRVLSQDGEYPFGNSYFKTNVLYKDLCGSNFITSLQAGKNWGVFIPADNATVSTTIHFKARIISNDTFSLQHTIDDTKEQAIFLKGVVEEVVEIPINNKNIKNWSIANNLVTRLYVENKERALADGLFIRQFFRNLNREGNSGFNFGTRTTGWAETIAPIIGDFDYFEATCPPYGKIAIKIADWDAIEWPSNGVISIGALSESNLEDIVFDWNEFVKPLEPTTTIADGSVTENKLSEEVKDKLNSSAPPLSRYELFSLGDSLSAGGVWQTKVAELTGCTFDQAKNNKGGAMLSVGGTSSYGDTFDNVLWRTKNLIDQNYITDDGKNTIVILENVNDGYQVFTEEDKTIIPTTPIEGYDDSDFGVELLNSISDKAALNAVLRLNKVVAGKNLKIDTLPTKAGTVTLRVGWAGPGYSNYNIYVEPQATEEETLNHVLDKILEYAYTGITDVVGEDGRSVDFSSGNSNYLPTVQFTDTDNTGMTVTVTDNPNAKGSIARYFIGEDVSEWTDTSKWQKGITYSQGWKSSIEMLQRAYPKLHIFVSMFPMHSVTASEYLLPNGSYDTVAYNSSSRMGAMRNMEVELKKIAEYYSLPFINVFRECGIGINNMLTYYNAQANVHPKNEGYYRFGETVAAQIKRFLP